jgi:hypothetical protein
MSAASIAGRLEDVLAMNSVFIGLSLATLASTLIVFVGLFLEYERREIWPFGLPQTRQLNFGKTFGTKRFNRPPRKHIGSFLVVAGVALEAFLGMATFLSATIRETRLETELIELAPRPELLYGKNRDRLIAKLKPYAGQKVEVRVCNAVGLEDEVWSTALLLRFAIFQEAGWQAGGPNIESCGGQGISVAVSPVALKRTRAVAKVVVSALAAAHLAIVGQAVLNLAPGEPKPPDPTTIVVVVLWHPL